MAPDADDPLARTLGSSRLWSSNGTDAFGVLQRVGQLARGASGMQRRRRADVSRDGERSPIDSAVRACDDARMTTLRRLLVDPESACDYHLASRSLLDAFLFGHDQVTGRDYSYRKRWLAERIKLLVCCFAIEIYSWCILSNHSHLVARYAPGGRWACCLRLGHRSG